MARIEQSGAFPVERELAFQYITDPANWREFWPDLVDIPDLDKVRWRDPGDSVSLRMRIAGRIANLHMTLDELSPPALVRYHTVQQGMPDAAHERHFEPAAEGFTYRLVVSYTPRAGLAGVFDRTLVRYAVSQALRRTLANLERQLRTRS